MARAFFIIIIFYRALISGVRTNVFIPRAKKAPFCPNGTSRLRLTRTFVYRPHTRVVLLLFIASMYYTVGNDSTKLIF